jgi:hypothetical protein
VLSNDSAASKVSAVSFRRAILDNSISDIVWKGCRVKSVVVQSRGEK